MYACFLSLQLTAEDVESVKDEIVSELVEKITTDVSALGARCLITHDMHGLAV